MSTKRMGLEQEDDCGLSAHLEVLEAMIEPGDIENQQLICLLLELKRRRTNAVLDEAERAELLAYREASKELVADVVAWNKSGEERKCDIRWRRFDVAPGPLFTAPSIQTAMVTFDELRDAVAEVTGGIPLDWPNTEKGHQAVPFMNFNSLGRIVDKFRAAQSIQADMVETTKPVKRS